MSTAQWVVRERWNYGPLDPRFLALDDIDLRKEYLRIRAQAYLEKHHVLPGNNPLDADSEGLDDFMALSASGLVNDDELWDAILDDDGLVPPK